MIPWQLLDRTKVPGGGDRVLELYRRGEEYSIRIDGAELMNSRVHASEEALATVAMEQLKNAASARVLVGGLGIGFTLAAVLRRLGPTGSAVVAELVPNVVVWNRGPMGDLAGRPLDDRRVTVREGDVGKIIRSQTQAFDALLLDVDNGPEGLVSATNDSLYGKKGLTAAYAALKPGGVLAIWASGSDATFAKRLRECGFAAEEVRARGVRKGKGSQYVIWIGKRAAPSR
jgi:spermidine synthase